MGNEKKQGFRLGRFLLRFILKLIPALVGLVLVVIIVAVPFVSTTNGGMEVKTVRPAYLAKDINIDGVHCDNYFLDKPVMQAHGEFYIPATRQMLSALGIRYAGVYSELEVLTYQDPWNTPFWKTAKTWLKKSRAESADAIDILEFRLDEAEPIVVGNALVTNLRAYTTIYTSPEEYWIARVSEFGKADIRNGWDRLMTIYAQNPERTIEEYIDGYGKDYFSEQDDFRIISEDGSELYFDADGMMYFSTRFLELLGMDCEYDDLTGLYISTVPGVSAASLYDENLAHRIEVLSDYMCSCNKKLDKETAIWYEYLFRHEANVNGIDELFVMSVAKVESNFRAEAKGDGTIGIMQPLAKYAINYGYDREMLLNPHFNMELCSMYLRDRYHSFGTEELALVAYNSGPAAVRAGRRTSDYSQKVLKIKKTILGLLDVQS